jgi:hypothetical protein
MRWTTSLPWIYPDERGLGIRSGSLVNSFRRGAASAAPYRILYTSRPDWLQPRGTLVSLYKTKIPRSRSVAKLPHASLGMTSLHRNCFGAAEAVTLRKKFTRQLSPISKA